MGNTSTSAPSVVMSVEYVEFNRAIEVFGLFASFGAANFKS